jgi:putative solute:sodium symporter small subunit
MVIVWAIAVFGFQIAMMLLNERVPETTLAQFNNAWPAVAQNAEGGADPADARQLARSVLMVLGKNIAVKDADKAVLGETLSRVVHGLLSVEQREALRGHVEGLVVPKGATPDTVAIAARQAQIRELAAGVIGLENTGFDKLMADLLPSYLVVVDSDRLSVATRQTLPTIMDNYLIHNQNVFTEMRMLGFPFHYWYSAQFLLIMFVVLCWVYAKMTDRMHQRHGFVEE